ncbi:hypothetical protein HPP92_019598 [Vanilla planifolia]|nr:hypothetical protein HPP92_019598 [Vanilla planifolia]
MPSTHSAGVAAAATSLGLERGFSDSIFGVSVIFAALVMYDAQGVRREVGYHAKILNELITVRPDLESKSLTARVSSDEDGGDLYVSETLDSYVGKSQPCRVNSYEVATTKLASLANSKPDTKESPQKCHSSFTRLNESVGHNEIQVIIGALLGFIVSLAVDSIL